MQNYRPLLRLAFLFFAILSIITCPLTSGGSLPFDGASASGLRQIDYTPELTPLILPTVPTQSFGTEVFEQPEQPSFGADEADVLLLQEMPDNGDPLEWIVFIEEQWENVDVISCQGIEIVENCTQWTARELKLLCETLSEYILQDYLNGQIIFIRTESADWSGLAHLSVEHDILTSEIWISDSAWRTPPAFSFFDMFDRLFRKPDYFQGVLAHELTHAAAWFHPELLQWWIDEKEKNGLHIKKGDWRLGWGYNWSYYDKFMENPSLYEHLIEGEFFAMSISALMYDPFWNKGNR